VFEEETTGKVDLDDDESTPVGIAEARFELKRLRVELADSQPNSPEAIQILKEIKELIEKVKEYEAAVPITLEGTTGSYNPEIGANLANGEIVVLEEGYTIEGNDSDINIVEKAIQEHGVNAVSDVLETMKNEPKAEKRAYNDEEAALLKETMTLAELGIYYGTDPSTIKRRLDKYKESLGKVEKEKEGEGA